MTEQEILMAQEIEDLTQIIKEIVKYCYDETDEDFDKMQKILNELEESGWAEQRG